MEEYSPRKFRKRNLRWSSSALMSNSSVILLTALSSPTTSRPSSQSPRNLQRQSSGRSHPPGSSPFSRIRTRGCPPCSFILPPKVVGSASGRLHLSRNQFQVIKATCLATCILHLRHVIILTPERGSVVIRPRELKEEGLGSMLPRCLCPLSACS